MASPAPDNLLLQLAECLRGRYSVVARMVVVLDGQGREVYRCPVPTAHPPQDAGDEGTDTVEESTPPIDDCDRAILLALVTAGHNLTGPAIIAALNPDPADEQFSERTISGHLAELVRAGRLVNPGKRQGYGLPGW